MDRELLIEIGCEEIPASWLPGLTAQMAHASRCAPEGVPADAGVAGRELQHPAAADREGREAGRASDRLRGTGHRPAGVGGVPEGRDADARRHRLCQEIRRRGDGAREAARRRREPISPIACSSAARPRSTCLPT